MAASSEIGKSFWSWRSSTSSTAANVLIGAAIGAGTLILFQELERVRRHRSSVAKSGTDTASMQQTAALREELQTLIDQKFGELHNSMQGAIHCEISKLIDIMQRSQDGLVTEATRHKIKRPPTIDEHKAWHEAAVSGFSAGLKFKPAGSFIGKSKSAIHSVSVPPWERTDSIWITSPIRPASSKASSEASSGSQETYASTASEAQPDRECIAIGQGDQWCPFIGPAAERSRQARLALNPVSARATDVCRNPHLYNLRQSMLDSMWRPDELKSIYLAAKDDPNTLGRVDSVSKGLFEAMYIAWSGAAKYAQNRSTNQGCGQALEEMARGQQTDAAVRIYADVHSAWSSESALRHAKSASDFDSLAKRIDRALTSFSFETSVDPLVKAELLQIAVDFMAQEAAASPHQQTSTRLCLSYFQYTGRGNKMIPGRKGTIALAHLLWQEGFSCFYEHGCYYDAAAMCVAMVLLATSTEGSTIDVDRYVQSMDCAIKRMPSPAKQDFEEYAWKMRRRLRQDGRISREFFDYEYQGIPYLRDNPIPRQHLHLGQASCSNDSRLPHQVTG